MNLKNDSLGKTTEIFEIIQNRVVRRKWWSGMRPIKVMRNRIYQCLAAEDSIKTVYPQGLFYGA